MSLIFETDIQHILVFTHNDADGIFGSMVIKKFFDDNLENSQWDSNVITYQCSYGSKFNLMWFKSKVQEFLKQIGTSNNVTVFMIDYAIQPNTDMIKFNNYLKSKGITFKWIDHHATAIENASHYNIPGFLSPKNSGAYNTWVYLSKEKDPNYSEDNVPLILKYVNDFDTWNKNSKFSWDDLLYPIIYFINSLHLDLNKNDSKEVGILNEMIDDNESISKYLDLGKGIYQYVKYLYRHNEKQIYKVVWNDYNCLVLNTTLSGIDQFKNHPDFETSDIMITWTFDGKYYHYGMYTNRSDIDVGELCQQYISGGGHKGAAGGMIKEMIF